MSLASPSLLGLEIFFVVILRFLLFFACRKYLLRNLYHDLQDLTAQQVAESQTGTPITTEAADGEVEMLPVPSSAAKVDISRQRPFHSALSRGLFSLCFSESCTLFLLLIFQAVDVLHPRVRLFNWDVSLFLLICTIVLVIPLSYSLVLSHGSASSSVSQWRQHTSLFRIVLNLIPVGLFLLILSYVPLPAAMPKYNIMAATLSRLTVLGTALRPVGFGAINTAWNFFPVFLANRTHRRTKIFAQQSRLRRVQDDLVQRRTELQKLTASQPNVEATWLSRVVPGFQGDSELSSVAQEISGLEALEYEMSRNVEALRHRHADAKFSKTLSGKVFNVGGRFFAVYCIYRIISSLLIDTFPCGPDRRLLINLPRLMRTSLGLVGVIILSSIRLVLRGVARALRVTSRNLGASLMLLMLAQLMGIYLLSTLIQLRTSFPPPPSRPDTNPDAGIVNLFSTLPEYQLFGSLFDGSFW
ncbi:Golgi pH regulator [Grifola frondosa]|uniref:Golgi pH regulator n=1 Tax=Grifola frondosa TaxID=5627 RepID=A0A1C7MBY0_GRIFR|nr:Golgi pH regulator [Grifola frondosa]